MKRLKRDPEKFEALDTFEKFSQINGYKLTIEEDRNDFFRRFQNSLETAVKNDSLIHGKRVQALFAYVANGLGECSLIKEEDSGNIFVESDDMEPPDYKIILKDRRQYFIEVKNFHFPNPSALFQIKKDYFVKLQNYADLQGIPLLIAVYYSKMNKWHLLSKDSFTEQKNRYVTNFETSMVKNEMSLLGDRLIGTLPSLKLELVVDKSKDKTISNVKNTNFTVGEIKLYCADKEITEEQEKRIAFYLMRFGGWEEQEPVALMENGELTSVVFEVKPAIPHENPEQSFEMIDFLSSMLSLAFNEQTVYEESVIALDTQLSPEVYNVRIPRELVCKQLPLWDYIIESNPEYQSS